MQAKKILHVANFPHIRVKGCFLNSMPFKISYGLTRNGHQVIDYPDRDMLRVFSMFGHMSRSAKKKANKNLLDYCKVVAPDAIIFEHADTIFPETVAEIRKALPNVKVMQINVDDINPKLGDWNINNIKSKLEVVDWTLITTADKERFKIFGAFADKIGFIPNPVDNTIETGRAFEKKVCDWDVICAANPKVKRQFCGRFEMTSDIIARIAQNIDPDKVIFPKVAGDKLDGANYQKTLENSAMGINLSRINEDYLYSSDRLAHLMGNGVLALVDIRTGYKDLFTEQEMVFFETEQELYEKIAYYRAHPEERMAIAKAGWQKYHELFNEKILARYVADLLFGTFKAEDYLFPTI